MLTHATSASVGCPGRFQITNADRRSNERSSKLGQDAHASTVGEGGGYCLDLIQIFHLRQQVRRLNVRFASRLADTPGTWMRLSGGA
jgi:hypothetical protein